MIKNKIFNVIVLLLIFLMFYFKLFNIDYFFIFNRLLCYLVIVIVLISSVYFSLKLKFLQINIFKIYNIIKLSSRDNFKALFMGLGSKIGVGSIVGISIALNRSGPGVLLWIWVISLLSSILTYVETYLGIKYKGGVFYYIKNGINNKFLSIMYTVILIFVYIVGFVGIQSNTIVRFTGDFININKYIIVISICYIITIIVFNNINKIINIMGIIVPVMCLLYLIISLFIIFSDFGILKKSLYLIFLDGLKLDRALFGIIVVGLQRGIFATESGIGTSSIVGIIGDDDIISKSLFQVVGVHFISFIIITITGIIIVSNNGIITSDSIISLLAIFNKYYGFVGELLLCLIIFLFAISTIISGYFYGFKGLVFLKDSINKFDVFILKILVIFISFLGGIVKSSLIWGIVDDLILFLLFINIFVMISLRDEVK